VTRLLVVLAALPFVAFEVFYRVGLSHVSAWPQPVTRPLRSSDVALWAASRASARCASIPFGRGAFAATFVMSFAGIALADRIALKSHLRGLPPHEPHDLAHAKRGPPRRSSPGAQTTAAH